MVRGASCYTKGPVLQSRVRHRCQNCPSLPSPVAELVLRWRLVDGRCQVQSSVALDRPSRSEFSVVFSENSRKYGLGSLRKTSEEGTFPVGPGVISGQFSFILQPTNQRSWRKLQQLTRIFLFLLSFSNNFTIVQCYQLHKLYLFQLQHSYLFSAAMAKHLH